MKFDYFYVSFFVFLISFIIGLSIISILGVSPIILTFELILKLSILGFAYLSILANITLIFVILADF